MSSSLQAPGGRVRLGLIGCGRNARAHANAALAHADLVRAVALADVNEVALAERNEQLGGGLPAYTDWREMLDKEADRLDAVVISLPHNLHMPAILDACEAGKHMLCEKPLCLTLDEADRIEEAVAESGVTYMAGHSQLFLPIVAEMKDIIDSGRIGRVRFVRACECFELSWSREKIGWRGDLKTQGGGELIDTGYHPTYCLYHLAGAEPLVTQGTFGRFLLDIEGEDTASVHVRFANGVIGEILTSWAFRFPAGSHQLHVVGDEGEVYGSFSDLYFKPKGWSEPARRQLPKTQVFVDQMECFARCLLEGRRPPHGVREARITLEMILAATASAAGWQETAPVRAQRARA